LGVLALTFITTLLAGAVPGVHAVWSITVLSGLALAAYVVMLVQLKARTEERDRKLHYLRPSVGVGAAAPGHDGVDGRSGVHEGDEVSAGYDGVGVEELAASRSAHPAGRLVAAR
jgi:hypothetical protein